MDYVEQIPSTDLMYGPGSNLLKVVIVPTPLDAQVIIEAGEYVPINNVVYVPSGTSIFYAVVKNGYISKAAEIIVTRSQNIYVELEKEQENMIYGWSTGVSENWSVPKVMRVRSDASDVYWHKVAYGKNKFVALDYKGYVSVSVDGINWSSGLLSLGANKWVGLAFDGVKFLALGQDGVVSTSTDGVHWNNTIPPVVLLDDTWASVAYGGGKFVALSSGGKISTSINGETWFPVQTISELGVLQWEALVYDGNKFVALSYNGYVSISEDGVNWTEAIQYSNLAGKSWQDLVYCNGKFTALGWEGYISTSEDGLTWSEALIPANLNTSGTPNSHWISIAYGNGEYIALSFGGYVSKLKLNSFYSQVEYPATDDYLFDSDGNIISRVVSANEYKAWKFSKDGINFTGYTTSMYPSSGDTVYLDTSGTTSFTVEGLGTFTLAVGSCDYKSIIVIPSTAYSWVTSTQVSNLGSRSWYALAYDGSKFVALGYTGYVSTSTDGTTWTQAIQNTNLGENSWYALAYDGTKFVALSTSGYISTSTDGTTWTQATQNTNLGSHIWRALAYDGIKLIALSSTGFISTSADGTTWTQATQNTNLGNNYWRVLAYDGTKFVSLSNGGYVSTSLDGTTWTQATQNTNLGENSWQALAYDGSKFVALGYDGYISTSTDGTTWTQATQNTDLGGHIWRALAYNGTKFVALSEVGYISNCQSAMKMKRELQLDETSSLIVQSNIDTSNWKVPVEALSIPESTSKWFGLAYDGYKYVALSQTGFISTSVDGEIWTEPLYVSNLGSRMWQFLLYNGTSFLALSREGYVSTSLNGITWEPAVSTPLDSQMWEVVAFDGSVYVAISATGYTGSSTDGINWSGVAQDNNLKYSTWYAMAYGNYNNGRFVAISSDGKVSIADGGTTDWSHAISQSQLAGHVWNSVVWNGSHFIAVATDGYVSKSVDAYSWVTAYPTRLSDNATEREVEDWDKLVYDGRRLLAVSQGGYVSTAERTINRDRTLDKVSKNKTQYFTVYGNSTSLSFANFNHVAHFPSPIVIDWGDGNAQREDSSLSYFSSVPHSYIEYSSISTNGYFQIKITSSSGLLSLTGVSNLYSWDSVLLPMVEADGVSYATTCEIFEGEHFKNVCSSPFQNAIYKRLDEVFLGSDLTKLSVNNLKEVQAGYFAGICAASGVRSANFNKLEYATSAFNNAFVSCLYLNDVNFDSLISVYGSNFNRAFYNCTSLTSVVFPVLESIQGSNCFNSAFLNDINLTEVKFPSLKYINGDSVFSSAFANAAVTDLYFPSLSPVNVDNGQFNGILEGNSNLKIHLPVNLEGKFSVGNAYYDLPPSKE